MECWIICNIFYGIVECSLSFMDVGMVYQTMLKTCLLFMSGLFDLCLCVLIYMKLLLKQHTFHGKA